MARQQQERTEQQDLRELMVLHGWHTEKSHGNKYQSGWPDLVCFHPNYGIKWIEMKVKDRPLKPSQICTFTKWQQFGAKIYVLQGPEDYDKLFGKPNWTLYLSHRGDLKLPKGFGNRRTWLDR
jgi:hypothetical protein